MSSTETLPPPAFDPFDYHQPDTDQLAQLADNRTAAKAMRTILLRMPESDERGIALERLAEALMWANKAALR